MIATNVLDGASETVLFIHNRTIPAELLSLTIVTLLGRDEFDPAVPVPMVVQVYERSYPLTGPHCGGKGLERIIRPVHRGPEQRF